MEESDIKDVGMQQEQDDTSPNIVVWAEIEENSEPDSENKTVQSDLNNNQDEDLSEHKEVECNEDNSQSQDGSNSNMLTTRQPRK